MNNIIITMKKELRSIFRDKKTLIMLFVLPIMIPTLVIIYGYMFDNIEGNMEESNKIGINYKPSKEEKDIIKSIHLDTKYYKNSKEMKKDLKEGLIDAYIVLENNNYKIYTSSNIDDTSVVPSKITSYLDTYNRYLGEQYILNNNLDPNKAYNNLQYEIITEENQIILNMIYSIAFTYTIMAIVIASSNMALNATATEKENGTLETILTLPIKTDELIIGKHLGGAVMSVIVSVFSLTITILSLLIGKHYFKSFSEFNLNLSFSNIMASIFILISASILISGLAISLTAFAKTTKEAQSKTQVLSFLSIIPMFINIMDVNVSKYIYIIPIMNYSESLMNIFNNKIDIISILIVFISSIIYIAIIIKIIISQYKEEKVLFAN